MYHNRMNQQPSSRYNGIAIGLHWLIALLILGLLAVGKYMTGLDENDASRYALTQWHKSFGIAVLLASVFRLVWRFTHRPPDLPGTMKAWEKFASGATHVAIYGLIIGVPLTGWALVSVSPLNVPTVLFGQIPWPHLPVLSTLADRSSYEHTVGDIHEMAANVLLLLVILHIAAALRHQFQLKDGIMQRMSVMTPTGGVSKGVLGVAAVVITVAAGLFAMSAKGQRDQPALAAGEATVTFTTSMMGNDLVGIFSDATVALDFDPSNPDESTLTASVNTASFSTGDAQVDSALPLGDWFDVENHPEATFEASSFARDDTGEMIVTGDLRIRDTTRRYSFPMKMSDENGVKTMSGGFTINRLDFDLGKVDQPDDSYIGYNVIVDYSFPLD